MASDPNCVFCKIIAGQIPCYKVYEDEAVLAFLDIGPLVEGHTLVIPKGHFATVMEMPAGVIGALHERMPKLAKAVLGAVGAKACHILVNNGVEAMQSVGHVHYHILPRKAGDAFRIPWDAGTLEKGTAVGLVESIKAKIGS